MSWTLDHVGPMCKTVEDAAIMLGVIAGYDPLDPASVDTPVADYSRAIRTPTSKLRVGVPRTPFFEGLNPEVATAVEAVVSAVSDLGTEISGTDCPN